MNLEALGAYEQYLTPAAIVLVGLIALWFMAKFVGQKVTGRRGSRLAVSEFHEIDKSRRLVLVRRDDVEHLVMIGGTQDMVIESGIGDEPIAKPYSRPEAVPSLDLGTPRSTQEPEDPVIDRSDTDSPDIDRPVMDRIEKILPREPKPAVFGDRAPNLRPAERSEPRFSQDKKEQSSS